MCESQSSSSRTLDSFRTVCARSEADGRMMERVGSDSGGPWYTLGVSWYSSQCLRIASTDFRTRLSAGRGGSRWVIVHESALGLQSAVQTQLTFSKLYSQRSTYSELSASRPRPQCTVATIGRPVGYPHPSASPSRCRPPAPSLLHRQGFIKCDMSPRLVHRISPSGGPRPPHGAPTPPTRLEIDQTR